MIKNFKDFLNESKSYADLEADLKKTFMKSDVIKSVYNGELKISGSGWEIPHPNGQLSITFWLTDNNIDIKKLQKLAKQWAKKQGLIVGTFYPEGVKVNDKSIQSWGNKAGRNADYVYGFSFYSDNYSMKSSYPEIK